MNKRFMSFFINRILLICLSGIIIGLIILLLKPSLESLVTEIPVINKPKILPLTKFDTKFNGYYYDTNNYNILYHDETNIIDDKYKGGDSGTWVKNSSGKLEYIKWTEIPKYSTYYIPGSLIYDPSSYVPSYRDSVYLKYNKNLLKNKK